MKTVYITETNGLLKKTGGFLTFFKGKEKVKEIKIENLSQIIVCGNIQITTQALTFLFKKGVDVVFLSLSGKFRGRLSSNRSKNIELRIKQFKLNGDDGFKLKTAKNIVYSKISNQIYFLRRQQAKRKKRIFREKINSLKKLLIKVKVTETIDTLRGIEGRASAEYFSSFTECFVKDDIKFFGRRRNPPPDEVNALLSLGYTLLLNTVEGFIENTSLDKFLGYFHTPDYGKPSLALDLMEPWRPVVVDMLVVSLVNQSIITKADFYYPNIDKPPFPDIVDDFREFPVVLKREGLRKFISYYERRLRDAVVYGDRRLIIRDAIREDINSMVKAIFSGKEFEVKYLR